MKPGAIAVCLLFLPGIAVAASCPIQSLAEQEAPVRVEITVLALGKPLDHARVDIFEYRMMRLDRWSLAEKKTPRLTMFANALGMVRSPKLPAGDYHLVATRGKSHSTDPYVTGNDLIADLYLKLASDTPREKGAFTMQLIPRCVMPPPTPSQWTPAIEQMIIEDRLQRFSGVVYDQSGGPIPEILIKVIRKGTEGKEQVAELRTDADGHFAAELPDGAYIAFFFSPAFKNTIVPFEITKEGSGELRIDLMVRSTT